MSDAPLELIDSHCHLEAKDFRAADGSDEREAVMARARAAGLRAFVVIGSGAGLDEVRNSVGLAEAHADLWATVAIHPHDVEHIAPGVLDEIERLALTHPRVVGVGETGLDFHYHHSSPESQRAHLRHFARLARRAGKPLSLHIRDAHEEAIEILAGEKAEEVGGVVHCFTGGPDEARRWLALGFHLSFSGIVTFKSAEPIREAARLAPRDRILLETDCPFLAPVPLRGKRNEPAYIVHTAHKVAEVRGEPVDELARAASANTRRLFRLPPVTAGTLANS